MTRPPTSPRWRPTCAAGSTADAPLAPFTWFRVGGPAEVLFSPADEDDLAYLLARLPREIPVTVIGVGSNLIVRDGGVRGVVIRLGGKAFGAIETTADHRVIAGAAALDAQVARAAAEAGIDGLAFLRGVPGSIGGALRMNAGAHGGETRDTLIEARGIDRAGAKRVFDNGRDGLLLSPQRSARRRDLHPRRVSGPPRRSATRSRPRWSASPPRAKPRSRFAKRPAARRSRTRRATRPGN